MSLLTIKDLIAELQKHPEDTIILIFDDYRPVAIAQACLEYVEELDMHGDKLPAGVGYRGTSNEPEEGYIKAVVLY